MQIYYVPCEYIILSYAAPRVWHFSAFHYIIIIMTIISCEIAPRTKIHSKLTEAQEKLASWLSAREQVYTKLGEWFV